MKQQSIFIAFCLTIALGLLQLNTWVKERFSDTKDWQIQAQKMEEQKDVSELKALLIEAELRDFKTQVAAVLPKKNLDQLAKADWQYELLQQSLRQPASQEAIELPRVLMARGKEFFQAKKWTQAKETFQQMIEKYPQSVEVTEAYFLKGESQFLENQADACLDTVHEMMTLFPDNKMTGFLMLRMGQILESRKKEFEANEVYRVVLTQFGTEDAALKSQALKMMASRGDLP